MVSCLYWVLMKIISLNSHSLKSFYKAFWYTAHCSFSSPTLPASFLCSIVPSSNVLMSRWHLEKQRKGNAKMKSRYSKKWYKPSNIWYINQPLTFEFLLLSLKNKWNLTSKIGNHKLYLFWSLRVEDDLKNESQAGLKAPISTKFRWWWFRKSGILALCYNTAEVIINKPRVSESFLALLVHATVGARSSFTEQYQLKEPPVVPLSSQAVQLSHSLSQRAVGRMMNQPNSKTRQTPQTCPISQIVHPVHSSFCITERGCPGWAAQLGAGAAQHKTVSAGARHD